MQNRLADDLIARGRGLAVRQDMLVAYWAAETSKLIKALQDVSSGSSEVMLAIGRQACRQPLSLRFVKLRAGTASCLVMVADPGMDHGLEPEALRAWYGLTPREAEIAALLAGGRSTDEVAQTLNITRDTAATHLKHIYSKLGINSQAQMVRLLSNLPLSVSGHEAIAHRRNFRGGEC